MKLLTGLVVPALPRVIEEAFGMQDTDDIEQGLLLKDRRKAGQHLRQGLPACLFVCQSIASVCCQSTASTRCILLWIRHVCVLQFRRGLQLINGS